MMKKGKDVLIETALTSDAIHHDIMPRTTVDIDGPLLKELKTIQKRENRSLGQIMSQLLAEALFQRKKTPRISKLHWVSRSMKARVDFSDKEALYNLLGL